MHLFCWIGTYLLNRVLTLCVMTLMFSSQFLSLVVALLATVSTCRAAGSSERSRGEEEQTRHIIRDCMHQLKVHHTDTGLTRKEFASLVDSLSGEIRGASDQHLSLPYSSVFNMNACLNGKDCVGERASISISSEEERKFTCLSLASLIDEGSFSQQTASISSGNETSSSTCAVDDVGDNVCTEKLAGGK